MPGTSSETSAATPRLEFAALRHYLVMDRSAFPSWPLRSDGRHFSSQAVGHYRSPAHLSRAGLLSFWQPAAGQAAHPHFPFVSIRLREICRGQGGLGRRWVVCAADLCRDRRVANSRRAARGCRVRSLASKPCAKSATRSTMARPPPLADLSRRSVRRLPRGGVQCPSHVEPVYWSRSSQLSVRHICCALATASQYAVGAQSHLDLRRLPWLRSMLGAG